MGVFQMMTKLNYSVGYQTCHNSNEEIKIVRTHGNP